MHTQSMQMPTQNMDVTSTCTISYLCVHSVAFKYNVADLNTACYCVKLQGDSKTNISGSGRGEKNLTLGRSGWSMKLERCLEHSSGQDL